MSMNPCLPAAVENTKKPAPLPPKDVVHADTEVKTIQAALTKLGFKVSQTGNFAEKTRQAFQAMVEDVQSKNGVAPNGRYDAETTALLMKSSEHKPIVEAIASMGEKGLKFVRLYRPAERPVELATSQKSVDCLLSMKTLLPADLSHFRYDNTALRGQVASEAKFMRQLLEGIQERGGLAKTGLYDEATQHYLRGAYSGPIKAGDLDALKSLGILSEKGDFVIERRVALAQKIIMETPPSADTSRGQLTAMTSPQAAAAGTVYRSTVVAAR